MIVPIPTDVADPKRRLERAHELLLSAKEHHAALPANLLTDASSFIPPAVAALAARTTIGILGRTRPPLNLVDVERAGPALAALHRGRPAPGALSGLGGRRRRRPQHHGDELPGTASTSGSSPTATRSRTPGPCCARRSARSTSWRPRSARGSRASGRGRRLASEASVTVEDVDEALIDSVCARLREQLRGGDADQAEAFARQYYRWVSPEDLAERTPARPLRRRAGPLQPGAHAHARRRRRCASTTRSSRSTAGSRRTPRSRSSPTTCRS